MKRVLINIDFKDVYTGKLYKSGEYANFTDERIAEIKAVNSNFVSVVGVAESKPATKPATTKGKSAKKTEKPEVKEPEVKEPEVKEPEVKEPEVKEPSADELIEELEKEEVEE